ncbi:hypothetical protein EW145_g2168 [Phellinidium pouzarii]|uniref:Phosphogluconate dehydrogenase NAD-binding putative C-terminal domain-containing protein n=1 Tax=Phellinidium pouzarii TaxID=167371 RepID=A0A4V3XDC5_9AGAM|nr:hypothetical protein EW145_g2168 [Phellinidium pouzarii]
MFRLDLRLMSFRAMATIAIVSPGAMGAGIAKRLSDAGCRVLSILSGRSTSSRRRAAEAGMHDASLAQIVCEADWVLSILPPDRAEPFVRDFLNAIESIGEDVTLPVFVDCNAKNPETAIRFARLFSSSSKSASGRVVFLNASIVGLPPEGTHVPTFYASAERNPMDQRALEKFATLAQHGLRVKLLTGDSADVRDASALKMSFSGIMKGMVGLYEIMILAAHTHSPAIADALLNEMRSSLPNDLAFIDKYVPQSFDKAYRFVREMEEMAGFVRGHINVETKEAGTTNVNEVGQIYDGLASLFQRLSESADGGGYMHKDGSSDVDVLRNFAEGAHKAA